MNNNFNNNNISARITDLESIITLILHELSNNSNVEGRNQIENHLENVQNVIDNIRNEMKSVLFYYYQNVIYKSDISSPSNDIKNLSRRLNNIHETVADMQNRLRKPKFNKTPNGSFSYSSSPKKSFSTARSLNVDDLL